MENTGKYNIKFTKIREGGKYYLVAEAEGFNPLSLFAYQIDMIAENPHKSIITPEMRCKDDVIVFYYDITGKKPLNECVENNLLNFNKFKEITGNILSAVKYGQGLLLYESNFLLKYEHIYMNDSCEIPSIIYLPFNIENSNLNIENNFQKKFKELILYVCGRIVVENNPQEKKFFKEITECIKNDEFTVDRYLELLKKYETEEKLMQDDFECTNDKHKYINNNKFNNNKFINYKFTNNKLTNNVGSSVSTEPENQEIEDGKIETLSIGLDSIILGYRLGTLLTALLVQIIVIALAFFIERHPLINNTKPLIRYGIIAGFILSADILLYIFVFLRDKKRNSCIGEKQEKSLSYSRNNRISGDFNDVDENFRDLARNSNTQAYGSTLSEYKGVSLICNSGARSYDSMSHDNSLPFHREVSMVHNSSLEEYNSSTLVRDGLLMANNEIAYHKIVKDEAIRNNVFDNESPLDRTCKIKQEDDCTKKENECTNISPYDETSFLVKPKKPLGFFVSCKNRASEKYEIKSENCIVGRNHHVCDFVIRQKTVGRVHAHIVCKDGEVWLYDKNSKNGTFINGTKLEPEEGYVLSDGDIIMFADVEYKYIKNF